MAGSRVEIIERFAALPFRCRRPPLVLRWSVIIGERLLASLFALLVAWLTGLIVTALVRPSVGLIVRSS